MRSYSVKENPIGSAVREILRYKHTDKHTDRHPVTFLKDFIILFRDYDSRGYDTEPLTFIQRLQLAEQTRFCNSMSNHRAMDRTRTKTREIAEDRLAAISLNQDTDSFIKLF